MVFPLPRECFENLRVFSLTVESITLFSTALSHESFAALLAILEIGSEKLIDSDVNFSLYEFYDSFAKNKAQLLETRSRKEVFFLEKLGGLNIYIQEGLKEADSVGLKFIPQKEYWNKNFYDVQKQRQDDQDKSTAVSSPFTSQTIVKPTSEQIKILEGITVIPEGENLKAEALAGTGKTTLCRFIAQEYEEEGNIIYLTFNKVMKESAKSKFQEFKNVQCYTSDGLAYKILQPWTLWDPAQLDREKRTEWEVVADHLGLPLKTGQLRRGAMVRQIFDTVSNYCNSSALEISLSHLPPGPWSEGQEEDVLKWAYTLWDMIINPKGRIIIKPQHVMKIWDLKGGSIPDDYTMLLLDEAQDMNDPFLSIVKRSKCKTIGIGDNHQQLYTWRGAINAMQTLEGISYPLTQSWRFGSKIAEYANNVLTAKTTFSPCKLIGNPGIVSQVIPYSFENPPEWPINVVLGRTNMQVFKQAIKVAEKGHRFHIVGGFEETKFLLLEALKLYQNRGFEVTHFLISRYPTWRDLVVEQEMNRDVELKRLIVTIEENHTSLENQLNIIARCHENDGNRAPLILSTTHKVKGREWDRVMLLNDFISPDTLEDFTASNRDNELNILYVAATRAIRELYVPYTHFF